MILHKDKENFDILIKSASRFFNVHPAIIEKDYYVTVILKELTRKVQGLLFKGGTSLSKCFKLIDRFSEDIDVTLDPKLQSQGNKRNLKYIILDICNNLDLNLLNKEETRSRRNYNCYKINFDARYSLPGLNKQLLIETSFIVKSFPDEIKQISSMIYDYLKGTQKNELISLYELEPFSIRVQTLERTLIDKVFAICDYMLENKIEKRSRHIYDIYCLVSHVKLDENLKLLVKEVRNERIRSIKAYSAQEDINIPELLHQIIEKNVYKNDYNDITVKLLSKPVSYEKAIKSIEIISNSGIFDE